MFFFQLKSNQILQMKNLKIKKILVLQFEIKILNHFKTNTFSIPQNKWGEKTLILLLLPCRNSKLWRHTKMNDYAWVLHIMPESLRMTLIQPMIFCPELEQQRFASSYPKFKGKTMQNKGKKRRDRYIQECYARLFPQPNNSFSWCSEKICPKFIF